MSRQREEPNDVWSGQRQGSLIKTASSDGELVRQISRNGTIGGTSR